VGGASVLSSDLARRVYEAFHPFGLGGTVTRSTTFEHVGSIAELPEASRSLLAQRIAPFYEPDGGEICAFEAADRVVYGSVGVEVTVTGTAPVLVEGCASCSLRLAGDNLVVGLEGRVLPFELPRGFVLDERVLAEGRVVVVLRPRQPEGRSDPRGSSSAAFPRHVAGWRAHRADAPTTAATCSRPGSSSSTRRPTTCVATWSPWRNGRGASVGAPPPWARSGADDAV
jgi:hypothetical protein